MRLRIATSGTDHSRDTAVRSSFAIGGGFLIFKLWPTICWSLSQHWLSRCAGQTQRRNKMIRLGCSNGLPWGQWPHENVLSARRATKLWLVPPAGASHGFFWWVSDGFLMRLSVDLLLIGGWCWFAELAKPPRTCAPVMVLTLSDAKAVFNSGMGIPILTDLNHRMVHHCFSSSQFVSCSGHTAILHLTSIPSLCQCQFVVSQLKAT